MSDIKEAGFKVRVTLRQHTCKANEESVVRDPRRAGIRLRQLQRRGEESADQEGTSTTNLAVDNAPD